MFNSEKTGRLVEKFPLPYRYIYAEQVSLPYERGKKGGEYSIDLIVSKHNE
jgi:hypothetical protein